MILETLLFDAHGFCRGPESVLFSINVMQLDVLGGLCHILLDIHHFPAPMTMLDINRLS